MKTAIALFALTLLACPPPGPPTPPPAPDATDASPALGDGSPTALSCPGPDCCTLSCEQMGRICGKQLDDCVRTQAHIESAHTIRESSGHWQTCADVAAATDTVQMRAVGVKCGQ